jgi:hypothetical protein
VDGEVVGGGYLCHILAGKVLAVASIATPTSTMYLKK